MNFRRQILNKTFAVTHLILCYNIGNNFHWDSLLNDGYCLLQLKHFRLCDVLTVTDLPREPLLQNSDHSWIILTTSWCVGPFQIHRHESIVKRNAEMIGKFEIWSSRTSALTHYIWLLGQYMWGRAARRIHEICLQWWTSRL